MNSSGIKGPSAAQSTAAHLENLIVEGTLRPGEPLLAERDLALRLDVSRPTLRQGMKILENQGLLVVGPDGRRVVAPLASSITDPLTALLSSRADLVDHYLELRANLESMAARLAATRASEVDRQRLNDAIQRIDSAHDRVNAGIEAEADLNLHVAIYEASHNLVLLHTMRAFSSMLRKGVFLNREKLYALPQVREAVREQHRAIVKAILAQDPEAAAAAAQEHMRYTREVIAEVAAAEARLAVSLRRIDASRPARGR